MRFAKKGVRKNQKAIFCDACDHWVHANCNGVKDKQYCELQEQDEDIPWFCLPCEISKNAELFSFGIESNLELLDLYIIDISSHFKTLPSYEIRSRLSKLPNLQDFDIYENFIQSINSHYFSLSELSKLSKARNDFSLFHMNLRSLSLYYNELCSLLIELKLSFDIIGITETEERLGKGFLTNISLSGYDVYSQPSKSSAGGSAIYVRSNLSHRLRPDLSALEEEFETVWVEIEKNKSKNILCCCAYRHPTHKHNQVCKIF